MTTPIETDQAEPEVDPTEDKGKGNSEAARYRTRLRGVEQERDALAQRVAAYTRADVVRHVAERLHDADDLFIVGQVDVADLVDAEGALDVEAVDAAVDALLERRPRLGLGWEPDAEGLDGGARRTAPGSGASWSGLLTGASGREQRR